MTGALLVPIRSVRLRRISNTDWVFREMGAAGRGNPAGRFICVYPQNFFLSWIPEPR